MFSLKTCPNVKQQLQKRTVSLNSNNKFDEFLSQVPTNLPKRVENKPAHRTAPQSFKQLEKQTVAPPTVDHNGYQSVFQDVTLLRASIGNTTVSLLKDSAGVPALYARFSPEAGTVQQFQMTFWDYAQYGGTFRRAYKTSFTKCQY